MSLQVGKERDAGAHREDEDGDGNGKKRETRGTRMLGLQLSLLCFICCPRPPHLKTFLLCASEFQGTEVQ